MTNVSMYVYEDLSNYIQLYPGKQDDLNESPLCSFWLSDKNLVIVSNTREKVAGYRPDFSKSIVYFDGGDKAFVNYDDKFEPVIEVKFDYKKNLVKFSSEHFKHEFRCARYVGEKIKSDHVRGYILYDDSRPRLNLIMKANPKL